MFANSAERVLQGQGTELVHQVLRAPLAVAMYAEKDPRVREFFYDLFRAGQDPASLFN